MHWVQAKGILSAQNGMNLYRGCTHGCIYCDSRSSCYHMEHAFEDIQVKENALTLLDEVLTRKRKKCMIATGSMSDPYMPLEATLGYTRKVLQIIRRHGFGATVLTKSNLVLRDIDILQALPKRVVQMTLTTFDDRLCRLIEPNVCPTSQRLQALRALRDAGIPTVVWLCPLLPFINDTKENLSGLLDACAQAGVYGIIHFGMGVTLREGSRDYFYAQLDRLFPGLKERYIRQFGSAYLCDSPNGAALSSLFHETCRRYGILDDNRRLFAELAQFDDPRGGRQISMFDGLMG